MTDQHPYVDLSLRGNVNLDLNQDVVRARDLVKGDVFEHPYSGELVHVEGVTPGPRGNNYAVSFVPYGDLAAPSSNLDLQWNVPVRTFPPVATAHTDLAADLARQTHAPAVPRRELRP